MAVFTSALSPEDAREIISAEVSLSHPHKAVQDCIFLYEIAIHYLLNNPNEKKRGENAFELVYNEYSKDLGTYTSDRDGSVNSC